MNRSSISASGKICKSLFAALTFFVLFAAGFTSCENFLKSEDVQAEIKNVIEYNNSPSYVINVEAITGTGEVKTPATHEVNKKVTDVFPIRFEAAEGHKFIRWEVQIKDIQAGEKPSDYVVFEDQTSLETNVTLLKGSSKTIVIRPVCPPKLTYTFTQGSGALYPRDSSPEFTFSQTLSDECFGVAVPVENYISVSNIEEGDIQNYFNSPRVNGQKLIFRSNSSNGYIPMTSNSQRIVNVKIAKDKIWYIITQYLEPIKVTLDEDIQVSFPINAETSAKTTIKYVLQQKDEKPLGIFKVDGEELVNKDYQYSVGQTVALRYKIPDGYTFAGWKFRKTTGEVLSLDDISLTVSDDDYSNNLLQTTFAIENYNSEVIVVTPELYEPVKFNFSKASDDTGTFKVEKTQITQEDQAIDFGVGQTFAISYKVPAGYYFYDWDFKKTYKDSSGATKTETVTKAELEELGIILAYDGDDDDTSYNSATRIAQMQVTIDEYTANEISVSPVCFKNLEVSFNMADSEKEYNRNSHLILTFNEKIPAACVQKLNIKIPGMPKDKTAADYFDIAGATFDSSGKRLTVKAKSSNVEELLPLNTDGINTITVTLLASDFYYEKKITEEKTIKIGLIIDTAFTYTINSKTENQTSILIKNEDGAPGIFKVNGQNCTNQSTKYSIGDKITLAYTLSEEEVDRYYFAGWKITREYKDENGNDQKEQVDINSVEDLNLNFEKGEIKNPDGGTVYNASITLTNYTDDIITIEPSVPAIASKDIMVDGEHGKFTPSKGQRTFRIGKINHLEFEPDSDYEFIRWQLINTKDGSEFERNDKDGSYEYLRATDFESEKADFELIGIPDDDEIGFELRPIIAERPQIISNTPINTALVNKDTTIQVMFDYDMDERSIYYLEEEVKQLRQALGIPEDELSNSAAGENLNTLLVTTVSGEEKCYGYTKGSETFFKNILITNNRTSENITGFFDKPVFENPRTLSINVKREGGIKLLQYTQVLVNIDKGFSYLKDGKLVSMAGSKKWVYQVNNETDIVGPGISEPVFKIGEDVIVRSENVPGLGDGSIDVDQLPYYKKASFNLELKIDDTSNGSGSGTNFTLACKKEYDENYNIIENPIVTNVGIDFDYSGGQIAEYNGNCADLYKLSSGVYSISIIARDKSGNESFYPPANDPEPNKKYYIVIDKTGPAITSGALKFENLEEEGTIEPVWDYSSVPDYDHAVILYAYNLNGSSYSSNTSKTINKGEDSKITGLKAGTKYRFDVYYYDYVGNYTNRYYYYAYTIPAKPKNVSVSTDYGTIATITAGKPDTGACSAIKVQYRIKDSGSEWTNAQDINTSSSASGSVTVSGLSKGQIYEFNIRSYDSACGKYSLSYKDASNNYPTFTTVPDAPASISTSFQSYTNQGNVSWTAPSSGNVTGYKVYCSTSSSYAEASTQTYTANSSTTSHTFTNLVPGTYYYVKVLTYYGNTDNVSSAKTTSTYTKPVAPKDLTCSSRTDNSITLSWKKPDSGYWSYYELKYKKSSASSWSTAASSINKDAIQYTISGLSAGETYNFNLRSKYQTAYSTDVQVTYQLCPAAASNLAATKISDTSFKASWTAPAGNFDGYNLYISNTESGLASVGPIVLSKTTTEYTKTNLTSKGQYYIKLETYIGTYNSATRLKTDTESLGISLAFDAVNNLKTDNLTNTGFNLTWTNPSIAFDGIEIYNGSTKVATLGKTVTSYSVSNLTPNTSYTYKVVTYKGSGSSRLAAEATITRVTLSSPVTYPSVTAVSPTSVKISWTNPSSSYYSSIYIYNATTQETIEVTKGETSYTVTELEPGKAYTFRVRTRNSSNAASTYTAKSVTTPPAPVTSLTSLSTGTTSKTISWTKPTGTFTGVYVYYKLSSASSYTLAKNIDNTTTTQATITGLSAGNTYNFKVTTYLSGVSNVGTSSEATLTSYTAPPAVTNFAVTRDSTYGNYLTFSWTNPAASNYEYVTLYYKKASASSWSSIQITKGDTSKQLNLSYGYRYEAYALTYYKGYSTYSSVYTPSAPLKTMTAPSNPYNFTVTSKLGTLIFTWDIGSGEQNFYRVQYRLKGNTTWNNFAWITESEGSDGKWEVTDTERNNGLKYEFRMYSQMDYSDYGGEVDSLYSGTQEYYTPPPKISSIKQGAGWSSDTNSAFKSITLNNWGSIKDIPGYVNVYVNGVYITSSVTVGSYSSYVKLGASDLNNGDTVYIVTYHKKNANHSESIYLGGKYLSVWSDETYGEIFSFTWNYD